MEVDNGMYREMELDLKVYHVLKENVLLQNLLL